MHSIDLCPTIIWRGKAHTGVFRKQKHPQASKRMTRIVPAAILGCMTVIVANKTRSACLSSCLLARVAVRRGGIDTRRSIFLDRGLRIKEPRLPRRKQWKKKRIGVDGVDRPTNGTKLKWDFTTSWVQSYG